MCLKITLGLNYSKVQTYNVSTKRTYVKAVRKTMVKLTLDVARNVNLIIRAGLTAL